MRAGSIAVISVIWLVVGCITYFVFGLFAVLMNPFGANGPESLPEPYQVAVLSVHIPMIWGWVPMAWARFRGRPPPTKTTRLMMVAAALVPPLFIGVLAILLSLR